MRTLKLLLKKEFKQIFRDKALLPMIFAMPILQLLVMPYAAEYEVKNINIAITDYDRSTYSRELVDKVTASGYFKLATYNASFQQSMELIEQDKADLVLEIPAGFEQKIHREGKEKVFIAVNAINGTKASLGANYLSSIIQQYNQKLRIESKDNNGSSELTSYRIDVQNTNWFNPYLNYKFFMVPGFLVLLVTMVGAYLCGLNIVKEKELGTIEQINVTPIKKYHYILGKLIPFWIIGMFIFSVGFFIISWMIFKIVPMGSILLLYAFLAIYLIALLGFGLLISTYSQTQQQAMSLSFFFMMLFILMSGVFTSIDSMPEWAKYIAYSNPVTYFIEVIRMVVLKGSGFVEISKHFLIIGGFALFFNAWAIFNYQKTS